MDFIKKSGKLNTILLIYCILLAGWIAYFTIDNINEILLLIEQSKHPYSNIDMKYEISIRLAALSKILIPNIFAIVIIKNQINIMQMLKRYTENPKS